jgi:hypothetical protein
MTASPKPHALSIAVARKPRRASARAQSREPGAQQKERPAPDVAGAGLARDSELSLQYSALPDG